MSHAPEHQDPHAHLPAAQIGQSHHHHVTHQQQQQQHPPPPPSSPPPPFAQHPQSLSLPHSPPLPRTGRMGPYADHGGMDADHGGMDDVSSRIMAAGATGAAGGAGAGVSGEAQTSDAAHASARALLTPPFAEEPVVAQEPADSPSLPLALPQSLPMTLPHGARHLPDRGPVTDAGRGGEGMGGGGGEETGGRQAELNLIHSYESGCATGTRCFVRRDSSALPWAAPFVGRYSPLASTLHSTP